MNKFNLLHPDDRPEPKPGILKRAWGQIKRPRSIALAGALALHAAVLPEPTKHIAKRVGLEALMVLTNQYPNSKKIIRQDFEITEERRLRLKVLPKVLLSTKVEI